MDDLARGRIESGIIGRPREAYAAGRLLRFYPATLGGSLVISAELRRLAPGKSGLTAADAARLARENPAGVSRVVAMSACEGRGILDTEAVEETASWLRGHVDAEGLARLMLAALGDDTPEGLMEAAGLCEDQAARCVLARRRMSGGRHRTFGGKTLWGALVAPACELFGCTPETAIWEVSLMNLRMTLADRMESVSLSDDDLRALGLDGGETLDGESMSMEELMSLTEE